MIVFNPIVYYIFCVLFNDAVHSSEYLMFSFSTKCLFNPDSLSIRYSQLFVRSVPMVISSMCIPHCASAIHLIFIIFVVDVGLLLFYC